MTLRELKDALNAIKDYPNDAEVHIYVRGPISGLLEIEDVGVEVEVDDDYGITIRSFDYRRVAK